MKTSGIMAVLQARTSSTRLPRKVLLDLVGEPMVIRQLERVSRCENLDKIVVATSENESDDELADTLVQRGVIVRRGPLEDVFARFSLIVDEFSPAHVVRLTADCPLTDPGVIDDLVALHLETGADYSSNTIERTFPRGLDVECMKSDVFGRLSSLSLTPEEREHVTLGIYTRPDMFTISSLSQASNLSHLRWTVDYPTDLEFVRAIYSGIHNENQSFGQDVVLEFLKSRPELVNLETD